MKILFITTQFPYPLDNGGKIGAYNGISVVAKSNDVTVISFTEEPQFVDEGIKFFQKKLPNVKFEFPILHSVHIRKKITKLFCAMLGGYIKRLPYIVSKFENKGMYNKIDKLFINQTKWDIVFIDYLNMNNYGNYIKKRYGNLVQHFILKDHNVEYELVRQEAFSSSLIKKAILNIEWKRTYKYETNAIKNSELVFTVCDENTEVLKKFNKNTWTMYPTYELQPSRKTITKEKSILYIGNLSWKSNMGGLKWFVENIFGSIKEKVPNATLTIVGGGCEENPFVNINGINYLGYVKDISHIYDDYRVFIVPLLEGSGIRIKILEAFNNEIAVVSTTLGCKTIGVKSGKELFMADTTKDFSEAVIKLLSDDDLNNKMRRAGKELIKNKFSLAARQNEFKDILSNCYKVGSNEK